MNNTWIATGASVAGVARKRNADRFAVETMVLADGASMLLLAVADGAGSARLGYRGAALAIKGLREAFARLQHPTVSEGIMHDLRDAALASIRTGMRQGAVLADYHTTLLALVIGPEAMGALQVGDGAIVVSDDRKNWHLKFWPARGECINETWFLTSDGDNRQQIAIGGRPAFAALFSDGFEPLALDYAQRTAASGLFAHVDEALHSVSAKPAARQRALKTFLSSESVRKRSSDDCTLVIARRAAL